MVVSQLVQKTKMAICLFQSTITNAVQHSLLMILWLCEEEKESYDGCVTVCVFSPKCDFKQHFCCFVKNISFLASMLWRFCPAHVWFVPRVLVGRMCLCTFVVCCLLVSV